MRDRNQRRINKPYAKKLAFLLSYYKFPVEVTDYGKGHHSMHLGAIYTGALTYPVEYMRIKVTFCCSSHKTPFQVHNYGYLYDTFLTQLCYAFGTKEQRMRYKLWSPTYG